MFDPLAAWLEAALWSLGARVPTASAPLSAPWRVPLKLGSEWAWSLRGNLSTTSDAVWDGAVFLPT